MERKLRLAAALSLASLTLTAGIAAAASNSPDAVQAFTQEMVSGKTMVSSAFPKGSITFNKDGSLTCVNYPTFVGCKEWHIEKNGSLHREFTDSYDGTTKEVQAYWRLLSRKGSSLEVSQTSNNSPVATILTVTCK